MKKEGGNIVQFKFKGTISSFMMSIEDLMKIPGNKEKTLIAVKDEDLKKAGIKKTIIYRQ